MENRFINLLFDSILYQPFSFDSFSLPCGINCRRQKKSPFIRCFHYLASWNSVINFVFDVYSLPFNLVVSLRFCLATSYQTFLRNRVAWRNSSRPINRNNFLSDYHYPSVTFRYIRGDMELITSIVYFCSLGVLNLFGCKKTHCTSWFSFPNFFSSFLCREHDFLQHFRRNFP